tara:strand:+ start:74 stop:1825 length:1752 start_codon:yes stop_codon:yes gene_type:complete
MQAKELISKYIEFFKGKGHFEIKGASLIPENDPTVLFTTAGMHPLMPFLLGQKHPSGKKVVNVQKCIRTGDIDDVGDASHLTFFEMLGNWSFNDYWKKKAIEWSFEFLTKVLGFDPKIMSVTVFAGDEVAPRDEEAANIWRSLVIPEEKIYFLPKEDNWWGPPGETGPCGPNSEMFIDTGINACGSDCKPGCGCGKYFEIWNDVFMNYNKTKDGKFVKMEISNVDTGMGVERTIAMLQGKKTVYETELFLPIMNKIKELSVEKVSHENKSARIIADHIRTSVFILGDENSVVPSNLDQGYILRRFIRRSIRHGRLLGMENFLLPIAEIVIKIYNQRYPLLLSKKQFILDEIKKEEERFSITLEKGLNKFNKICDKNISGVNAFLLFQSFGFPIEMIEELAAEKGVEVDVKGFHKEFEKHQQTSRAGGEKRFKGGLADSSEQTKKLHTATHLLNEALRHVLGKKDIVQKGSNITPERLRFDFNFDRKVTKEELQKVEDLVNEKISAGLDVVREEMSVEEAKKRGAQAEFEHIYGDKVSVYHIVGFSTEICMGPHVDNTSELGHFKIKKEQSIAAGVRRIKAVLE